MSMHDRTVAVEQAAWNAARRLGTFHYERLSAECSLPMKRTADLVQRWKRAKLVEDIGKQGTKKQHFRVLRDIERLPITRRAATAEGNMWQAIRAMKNGFTPTDIAAHATTDEVTAIPEAASAFCQMLVRAGYLRVTRKAVPGRREAIYRLIRDTGPLPPRERRVRVVWDENEQKIAYLPKDREGGA